MGDRDPVAAILWVFARTILWTDHSGETRGRTSTRGEVAYGSSQCRVFGVSCIFYIHTAVFGTPMLSFEILPLEGEYAVGRGNY